MFFDPRYMIMILPALLLSFYAQMKVKTTFARFSAIRAGAGYDAASVCRKLLDGFGLNTVRIERVPGSLTDHYDPRSKVLRLSDSVGGSASIAAIGVAAHEVGHAVQDLQHYAPLHVRNSLVPVANIGSNMGMLLFLIGIPLRIGFLMTLGIVLFSCAVLFQIVTLPVEFDASRRALAMVRNAGIMSESELQGAKSVLSAAALTYVAATLMAVMQLLYLLSRSRGRRR
ncbi:MAG: zinc metallopeptidase [Synergistaceae bacterium]|jgi:Zn-dependent membrane protease YugP|nr:zinc metallopeptidase [Synergistaceae bacterium]